MSTELQKYSGTRIFELLTKENIALPVVVSKNFELIKDIINNESTMPELYGKILSEIPVSTSLFQDKCVQYEVQFTSHRKLRQAMLEMDGKLQALYAAKTGNRKADLKIRKLLANIEDTKISLNNSELSAKEIRNLEFEMEEYLNDLEEVKRDMKMALHMVKDAMLKIAQQKELIDVLLKEVEDSGLSYEESEVIYYVMYFTKDAEVQLRTMGRVDTGTYGAIAQLPEGIRKKVLSNIEFIKTKLQDDYNGDYIYILYRDQLIPKKTGEMEYEGMKLCQFLGIEPIKILASKIEAEVSCHEGL